MNRKLLFTFAISILLFVSCGQRKELTYNSHTSVDNTYSVEIPSCATQYLCDTDMMSFMNEKSRLTITIQHIPENRVDEYIRNKIITHKTFTYNLFQSSDTTSFYKVTRGNNMWSAYDLYMQKRMDENTYIINVSSDTWSKSEMIEIINHIYNSMSQEIKTENGKEEKVSSPKDTQGAINSVYSNNYYSIKYPKGWSVIEQLNEPIDVYIGSEADNFGFTIVRFETDYSLSKINTEGNEGLKQGGFRIKEDKAITLKGLKCYKAIHEVSIKNQTVKLISYTFKKGNMLYNIKFGNITTKAQETLASEIIETLNLK